MTLASAANSWGCEANGGRVDTSVQRAAQVEPPPEPQVVDLDIEDPAVKAAFEHFVAATMVPGSSLEDADAALEELASLNQEQVVATLRTAYEVSDPMAKRFPIIFALSRLPSEPTCAWAAEYLTTEGSDLAELAEAARAEGHDVAHDGQALDEASHIAGFIGMAVACDVQGFHVATDALLGVATSHHIEGYRHAVGYHSLWFASPSTRTQVAGVLSAEDFDILGREPLGPHAVVMSEDEIGDPQPPGDIAVPNPG
ncbi:MAG: hypothetical protein AAGA56_04905 [Myxococcota bacterium]